ncbi:substrate-binding domain-containing protein [Tessaracoccus sp. Z1128]
MRKLLASFAIATVAIATLGACTNTATTTDSATSGGSGAAEGTIRVALIAKGTSDYWTLAKDGAMAAGEDLGAEVSFNAPDTENEGDKQLNQLQAAINDQPDGVGIAPQDGAQDGAPAIVEAAAEAGIPTVVFDTPLKSTDAAIATIASDNPGIGAQAAEELSKLIGGKGKVAMITNGESGTAAARRDGFTEWLEANAPDIEVVDIQNGESDQAKSSDKAQAILQANPDLAGFAGTSDFGTIAIADQVAAMGMDTKVVGIDAPPDVLTLLSEGKVTGVVAQNPYDMGYQTVKLLVEAAQGTQPSEKSIISESVWVTKDNMNDDDIKKIIGIS